MIFVSIFPTNNTITSTITSLGEGYFTVAPKIHALLAGLTFVVIPIVVILQSLIQMKTYDDSYFTGSLWLYPLVSFVSCAIFVPFQGLGMFRSFKNTVVKRKEIRTLRGAITDWTTLNE